MAEKSSFFNSVNGDRRYKADDFANYFNKFITNGYFPNMGSNLQVVATGSNMNIILKIGAAWINGYMYTNTTDLTIPIPIADGSLNRIDRIVISCNFANREIKALVKKGDAASSPIAKPLQRDADIYELGIADVFVGRGVTSINQAIVTDTRLNTAMCGPVNSLLQADTTAIFNQFQAWFNMATAKQTQNMAENEAEFDAWFLTIKNKLAGDVAAKLTADISELQKKRTVGKVAPTAPRVNDVWTDTN